MSRPFALFLIALLSACKIAPYTGRRQLILIPAAQEMALGLDAYQQTLQSSKLSTDAAQIQMVQRVGARLALAADKPEYKWEFNLIEDAAMVNAFCLPGGKVAVYTGILPVTRDEDGMAVVLGHEIAHALARHGDERMSQGLIAQFGGVALDALIAEKPAEVKQLYSAAYGTGAQVGVLLPYGRKQESEADRIGLVIMAKAGYDPNHAIGFWQRMMEKSKGQPDTPTFLRSHPADEKRINDIQSWLPEATKHRPGGP